VLVLFMGWVVEGFEELAVAWRAADIFGWAAACGSDEQG